MLGMSCPRKHETKASITYSQVITWLDAGKKPSWIWKQIECSPSKICLTEKQEKILRKKGMHRKYIHKIGKTCLENAK